MTASIYGDYKSVSWSISSSGTFYFYGDKVEGDNTLEITGTLSN